ncbi:MAG: MFS transporter [Flavobacteriales bacterium]|nr:MFS transporter [Flavobacteriales bacterium]MCB9447617.1 MFS transporter [Flavobacteriales bacterium]
MIEKGNKKIIRGWAMYDWANSVYSLVITSTIFPIYYNAVTSSDGNDQVVFLGRQFTNTALYSYTISAGFLLVVLISPLLSGIADYSGRKKAFMRFFCYLGSAACCALYFFDKDHLGIGLGGLMLATMGFSGSLVFYNAYLPEIAEVKDQDRVSALGFGLGYVGSAILLIVNLIMIMSPETFGMPSDGTPARISFVMTGIWWFGFSHITFRVLPKNVYQKQASGNLLTKGYAELLGVWKQIRTEKALPMFLTAFFVYSMGVQTMMYMAASFGDKEISMKSDELITTILIIQFVAMIGAWAFSRASSLFGNIRALSVSLVIWVGICVSAYFVYTANAFYLLAAVVGLVMGGIQSLSRSTYAKMLPETHDHASYFSFYELCEKTGIVLGTASYGLIEELTGSMRNSVFALIVFFVVGWFFLFRLPRKNTDL